MAKTGVKRKKRTRLGASLRSATSAATTCHCFSSHLQHDKHVSRLSSRSLRMKTSADVELVFPHGVLFREPIQLLIEERSLTEHDVTSLCCLCVSPQAVESRSDMASLPDLLSHTGRRMALPPVFGRPTPRAEQPKPRAAAVTPFFPSCELYSSAPEPPSHVAEFTKGSLLVLAASNDLVVDAVGVVCLFSLLGLLVGAVLQNL